MLTKKQHELLIYINDYIQDTGLSPSYEEMKQGVELRSKSGIHRLVSALVERGFLVRLPNKARALEVKKLPENKRAGGNVRKLSNSKLSNKKKSAPIAPANQYSKMAQIPLYGKIAAGTPIDAIRNEQDMIDIPANMLGMQMCYALTVEGDSMIKAGIMDGDVVIIERCDRANDGDIVVALVDGEEATLKRLRREFGSIILLPENDAYAPIRLTPDRVQIQGRIRSLLRQY